MNNELPSKRVILHQCLEFSYWVVIIITIALSYRYLPESRTDLLKYFEHEHFISKILKNFIKYILSWLNHSKVEGSLQAHIGILLDQLVCNYLFPQLLLFCINYVYYSFYADKKHSFLSTLYQKDKYGIVINYCLLMMIRIADSYHTVALQIIYREIRSLKDGTEKILPEALARKEVKQFSWPELVTLLSFVKTNTLVMIIKCLIVLAIFSMNTSDEITQKNVHVAGVFILIVTHIFSLWLEVRGIRTDHWKRKTLYSLVSFLFFVGFSKVTTNWTWSEDFSLFFETLALSSTIGL